MSSPAPTPRTGLRQLTTASAWRSLVHRPRSFLRNLLQGPEFLLDRRHHTGVEPFRAIAKSEPEAVCEALGIELGQYEALISELWTPEADSTDPLSAWNARDQLLRIVGATVQCLRPEVMVETGVAVGFTTATVLRAMEENGRGRLYSIDLPALQYDTDRPIGSAVPEELKHRWDLRLGDSRKLLRPLAEEVGPVDIFLHDALHTYASQRREYRTMWPHLRSGGVLISDDVENPALIELAQEVGVEPQIILGSNRRSEAGGSAIGLLRRP